MLHLIVRGRNERFRTILMEVVPDWRMRLSELNPCLLGGQELERPNPIPPHSEGCLGVPRRRAGSGYEPPNRRRARLGCDSLFRASSAGRGPVCPLCLPFRPAGQARRSRRTASLLQRSLDTAALARHPSWILDSCQRGLQNRLQNCWPEIGRIPFCGPTQEPVWGRIRAFARLWRQAL